MLWARKVRDDSGAARRHGNAFAVIRLVLASLVILAHSPEILDGDRHRELMTRAFGAISFGEFAVDGFFALSGFLLTESWLRQDSAFRYFVRRVLRIFPGFIVASALSVVVVGALAAARPLDYLQSLNVPQFLLRTLALGEPVTPPTDLGLYQRSVNGALWTIRYEFICYFAIPLLGLLGVLRRRSAMLVLTLLSIVLFASSHWWVAELGLSEGGGAGRHLARLSRLWTFFCAGSLASSAGIRAHLSGRGAIVAAVLAVFSLVVFGVRGEPLLALPLTYLLIYAGYQGLSFASDWIQTNDISYGVYLYAWPLQKLFSLWFPGIGPWQLSLVTALLVVPLAALSWKLVEQPAVRLSERIVRSPPRRPRPVEPLHLELDAERQAP